MKNSEEAWKTVFKWVCNIFGLILYVLMIPFIILFLVVILPLILLFNPNMFDDGENEENLSSGVEDKEAE